MAKFQPNERHKLEKLFGMAEGYVLNFSNRTFSQFINDSNGRNIDNEFIYGVGSKANRLRTFFDIEPDFMVGKLVCDLVQQWRDNNTISTIEKYDFADDCFKIGERLKNNGTEDYLNTLESDSFDKEGKLLFESIKQSIEAGHPEGALDRLHTWTVRYLRLICLTHGLSTDQNTALHALFGIYTKYLHQNNLIETSMTKTILSNTHQLLNDFCLVRNNHSLAHANNTLNSIEAMLIFKNITASIDFIQSIEKITMSNIK